MNENSPEFIARLIGGEIEPVEGGEGAFDDEAFMEEDDGEEFEET